MDHFQSLFSLDQNTCGLVDLEFIEVLKLSEDHKLHLMQPSTKGELQSVIFKMNPDKAPKLDGFNVKFYPYLWSIVKDKLLI